jgi:hypothetical protein
LHLWRSGKWTRKMLPVRGSHSISQKSTYEGNMKRWSSPTRSLSCTAQGGHQQQPVPVQGVWQRVCVQVGNPEAVRNESKCYIAK